jgi:hypothetical protein
MRQLAATYLFWGLTGRPAGEAGRANLIPIDETRLGKDKRARAQ